MTELAVEPPNEALPLPRQDAVELATTLSKIVNARLRSSLEANRSAGKVKRLREAVGALDLLSVVLEAHPCILVSGLPEVIALIRRLHQAYLDDGHYEMAGVPPLGTDPQEVAELIAPLIREANGGPAPITYRRGRPRPPARSFPRRM